MERKIEYGQERLPFASERISTLPWWMKSRATPTRAMYVPSPQTYKTFSVDSQHTTTCCIEACPSTQHQSELSLVYYCRNLDSHAE